MATCYVCTSPVNIIIVSVLLNQALYKWDTVNMSFFWKLIGAVVLPDEMVWYGVKHDL